MLHDDQPGEQRCTICGFRSADYDDQDAITSQHLMPAILRAAVEELPPLLASKRSADSAGSIEDHLVEVAVTVTQRRKEMALVVGTAPPDDAADDHAEPHGVAGALASLDHEFSAVERLLKSMRPNRRLQLIGEPEAAAQVAPEQAASATTIARQALHDGFHALAKIGRLRHALGAGAEPSVGYVTQFSTSAGGVPKTACEVAEVTERGISGDVQSDRRHHGRPLQAVCLWSEDVLAALRTEGHPIHAGAAGENLTVGGVEWSELRPGSAIEVSGIPMLITAHAVPCAKNAQWFSDRDFSRIRHELHPGWSRLYALPLAAGTIRQGDPFVVEP